MRKIRDAAVDLGKQMKVIAGTKSTAKRSWSDAFQNELSGFQVVNGAEEERLGASAGAGGY
jgi:hypothetical protein